MQDFEKLGQFFLGREYDLPNRKGLEDLVLYDSKDLCTHAVVVGMTGSGKTGLCVGLLEEAGMDRIPAIVIDPKGDIANLLLTFPDLSPEDFKPWVDPGQADRKGISIDEYAAAEAEKWKSGLESWGQDGERIRKLRETVDMKVYTPGSNSGRPLTILKSFAAPNEQVINDPDAMRERIGSATSGLLALLGIDADPINSPEHILISKILDHSWEKGKDLDLGGLIAQIQKPPFEKVGIMEIDSFFDKKDRNKLAMTINNLLASPSFESWMTGEPLDIKRLLNNEDGKPCISILSIAHLSDPERMFFVTILLNEVLAWMRSQPGTSSLRALLYMDEVFGYFPPTKNPPSKQPMLTLLKQARAFGLGVVLATQNPVDLDYKGLSNTGTWFLGRLQTERDKMRVLEGLEGASSQAGAEFDRGEMEEILAGLGSRVFLMNNVHDDEPVIFETRWAMSYLRGPMTRQQIQKVVKDNGYDPKAAAATAEAAAKASGKPAKEKVAEPEVDSRQSIPPDVDQQYVEPRQSVPEGSRLIYRPSLIGRGRLHFVKSTYKVDEWQERTLLAHVKGGEMPNEIWDNAEIIERLDTDSRPEDDAKFGSIASDLEKAKNYKTWEKELKEFLYRGQNLTVFKCTELKKYSEPGETVGDFKVRLEQIVSEERDEAIEKLRKKYASKFTTLRDRIRRGEDKIEKEESEYKSERMNSMLSIGTTLMGALMGRKTFGVTNARRAGSSMRSYGRAGKQKDDIGRAEEALEELHLKFQDLEREFNDEVKNIEDKLSIDNLEFEELEVTPRKSDISVEQFSICWLPWRVDADGIAEPIY